MNVLSGNNYCFGQFEFLFVTSLSVSWVTNLIHIYRLSSQQTQLLMLPSLNLKQVLIALGDDSAKFRGSKECTGSDAKGLLIRGILRFPAWLGYNSKRLPIPHH